MRVSTCQTPIINDGFPGRPNLFRQPRLREPEFAPNAQLVDLSITGAQAFVLTRLRPDQPVRVALLDGSAEIRCRGVVVWSVAEPGQAAVRYRIGVQFVDPGKDVIEAFCVRYGARPDQTFGAA